VLKESKDREQVEGVAWADNTSLDGVLHVHVIVIVAVSVIFKAPTRTILELLRNLPPVPV
jgi:hypothetical protein